jgi:hypothetical protein
MEMSIHVKLLEVRGRESPAIIVTADGEIRFVGRRAIYKAKVLILKKGFDSSIYSFFCRYVYPFEN